MVDLKDIPSNKAQISLERVQEFDPESLSRDVDLGTSLNFREAVSPAKKAISLFQQFPSEYISELPQSRQNQIQEHADSFFNLVQQILKFDPKQDNAYVVRTSLIDSIAGQYESYFNTLFPLISYASSRTRDFRALEREARAAMQSASDRASEVTLSLKGSQEEADRILSEVRKVAAEQGVSQQAMYFQAESTLHDNDAKDWRTATIWTAIGLGLYAVISAMLHKISWLAPTNNYEAIQLGLSKVLIFGVIAYMLVLCARNFLSHRHNAVINRHRQNALLTFNALVGAAKNEEQRDIVLSYAAACIFAPQDTGFTKGGGAPEIPSNIVQAVPKIVAGTHS